jgi:hypothetical protein
MHTHRHLVLIALGASVLAGCGRHPAPADIVDSTTRAIYANDYDTTRRFFDAALKPRVTRQSVTELASRMQEFGEYRGVSLVAEITHNRRYDFEAAFAKGSMLLQVRIDPDGTLAAYRVIPNQER